MEFSFLQENLAKLLFLLVVTISSTKAQNVIPPEIQTQIDALLESWMNINHIPGLGLAITRNVGSPEDEEILYTKGYGLRDVENRLLVENTTLFSIGSITKSFTATIVAKTLSEMFPEMGGAVLDTPIRTLAPGYRGNLTLIDRYRSESTTFRDLLSHRVCTMPESLGMWIQSYANVDELFYRHRYAPEICSFRNGYWYNNGLIAMAGDIMAHMANTTYNDMLTELLVGIGMSDTTWIKETDDHNNMMGRSVPYLWKDEQLIRYNTELLKSIEPVNAAGGMLSSANDMIKYMQFHLDLGKVGDEQLVSQEAMLWLQEMSNGHFASSMVKNGTVDLQISYGLCLFVGVYDGWFRIGHAGNVSPYESLMNFYPELNLGVFTTINGPGTMFHALMPANIVHNQIFDILQGNGRKSTGNGANLRQTSRPYPIIRNKNVPKSREIKISPEEAVGVYGSGLNGEMSINFTTNDAGEEQLFWQYGVWGRGWLTQISTDAFHVEWTTDFWMRSWSDGLGPLNTTLTFLDLDTIEYRERGVVVATHFERGVGLDDLPEIPWSPDSCASE